MNKPYKSTKKLTTIVLIIIFLSILCSFISLISEALTVFLLSRLKNGIEVSIEIASSCDTAQFITSIVGILLSILNLIFFLIWIHHSNRNLHSLGSSYTNFTPGWSVGWFFIPIACYFKPYQVVKEIWLESSCYKENDSWHNKSYSIIKLWWFFWIIQECISKILFRFVFHTSTLDELYTYSIAQTASDVFDIIVSIFTAIIVYKISKFQEDKHMKNLEIQATLAQTSNNLELSTLNSSTLESNTTDGE